MKKMKIMKNDENNEIISKWKMKKWSNEINNNDNKWKENNEKRIMKSE